MSEANLVRSATTSEGEMEMDTRQGKMPKTREDADARRVPLDAVEIAAHAGYRRTF
jgi:hypothetical protein